jgi:hypothetical protein
MSDRRNISKHEREYVWEKADEVPGRDPDYYRQDKCGNVIYYDSYGKDSNMGWNVDHSKPIAEGGTYHLNNLQVMQTSQNKSKGATYRYDYDHIENRGSTQYDLAPTQFDRRSELVRNGDLQWNYDGSVDARCSAVRSGEVTLNNDGSIRKNCRAANDKTLLFKY